MNRFPIWKGKRIGRYDDRLILRSVIFFALTVAALSVFTIWLKIYCFQLLCMVYPKRRAASV